MAIQIHTQSREDSNNRSMIQPPARTESGLTLRPISLGSLEILRQLGNPLSAGNAQISGTLCNIAIFFIQAEELKFSLMPCFNR